MRYWIAMALLCAADAAFAQLRTIPAEAKRGEMQHVQEMLVELDGKPQRLSPGVQIRDPDNRLVLPMSLLQKLDVKYLVDGLGNIHRVWILTAQERAQADLEAAAKLKRENR